MRTAMLAIFICTWAGPGHAAPAEDRDKDGDGLSDFHELHKHRTDPNRKDSDGDGIPDGDWQERREYQYTVRSVVQVMNPVTIEYLTDDYQDARILDETETYVELEVIHYPFNTVAEALTADSKWSRSARRMREWLEPGPTSDWNEKFRKRILADLDAGGIEVAKLDDRSVVERASQWLLKRARYQDGFSTFITAFDEKGRPYLPDELRGDRTEDELARQWEREISARGMYEHEQRGSCTSSAIYLSGCLRAIGIPTRTVLCIPLVDASDDRELELVRRNIQHPKVRAQLLAALEPLANSWSSHTLNEVHVGGRWRRLNYEKLGQGIYDRQLFGLITHVATFRDWADAKMANTIGRRQSGLPVGVDVFGGRNPYSTISLRDAVGVHCKLEHPGLAEERVRVTRLSWTDSEELPADIRAGLEPRGRFGLIAHAGGLTSFDALRSFLERSDLRVFLEADGQALKVGFDKGCVWYRDGAAYLYIAFGSDDRRDLKRGVRYRVRARNQKAGLGWDFPEDATVVRK